MPNEKCPTRALGDRLLDNCRARSLRVSRGSRFVPALPLVLAILTAPKGARADDPTPHDGEAEDAIEHTLIFGLGGATDVDLGDGSIHPGANVMVEWDAIEDWLELEVEASVLSTGSGTEVPVGLLIKKPFRLTRTAELMIGLGPELVRVSGPGRGTYFGGQFALDFMFWPTRHVGFWVEPAYEVVFHAQAAHGLGCTGGLLVGW